MGICRAFPDDGGLPQPGNADMGLGLCAKGSIVGMDVGGLVSGNGDVEAVVEMMLDATSNDAQPLTADRLFAWHAALFPTGRAGYFGHKAAGKQTPVKSHPTGLRTPALTVKRWCPTITQYSAEMGRIAQRHQS
jgi:hypothetical protein